LGAAVAAFNREAHAIADALRAELAGWDIEVVEIDSWLSGLRT
jgi:outer membrane biogenesis lipoprotein LolB